MAKPKITTQQRNRDYSEAVAQELIGRLKEGTAPWQKPWEPGETGQPPLNATTGNPYRGGNALWLEMNQPNDDPRWMTYRQAAAEGWQVRKGEKGTMIEHWRFTRDVTVTDENGKPIKDEEGNIVKEQERLAPPQVRHFTVFHASQIDGIPEWQPPRQDEKATFERHQEAERLLAESGAVIRHGAGDRAYYTPQRDRIHLPDREQFKSPDAYYATALHELGHWTGHESRLNRDLAHRFGSEGYAREELRAEISSMMVGRELGIGHDPDQHAAYVGSWIKVLEEDPREIFRAAGDAERIKDFVLQPERQRELADKEQQRQQAVHKPENKDKPAPGQGGEKPQAAERTYFNVAFRERLEARQLGAKWDRQEKSWYADRAEAVSALDERFARRAGEDNKELAADNPAQEEASGKRKRVEQQAWSREQKDQNQRDRTAEIQPSAWEPQGRQQDRSNKSEGVELC